MSSGPNNQISFRNTLESTQPSNSLGSGALVLKGGLSISLAENATSPTSGGALTIAGGAAFGGSVYVAGEANIANLSLQESLITENIMLLGSTPSTSPTTGVLLMSGGIGIANTTDSTDYTNGGTITTAGGASVAKTLRVGTGIISETFETGTLNITSNTASTSPSTGAITIAGGLSISNTSDAISSIDGGACTILGGLAIGKQLHVGDFIHTNAITSTTLALTQSDTGSEALVFNCAGTINLDTQDSNFQSTNTISVYTTDNTNTPNQILLASQSLAAESIKLQANNGGVAIEATQGPVNINSQGISLISSSTINVGSADSTTIDSQTSITVGASSTGTTIGNTGSQLTLPGIVSITNTTASSDVSTGALTIAGGLGVSGNVYAASIFDSNNRIFSVAGANLQSSGVTVSTVDDPIFTTCNVSSTDDATNSTTGGAATISGGLAVAKKLYVGDSITVPTVNLTNSLSAVSIQASSTDPSTSSTTGAIRSAGGIGISNTTDSTDLTNGGAMTISGGASIAKTLRTLALETQDFTSTGTFDLSGKIVTRSDNTFASRDFQRQWKNIATSETGQYQAAVVSGGTVYNSSNFGVTWTPRTAAPLDTGKTWTGISVSSDGTIQTAVANGDYIYTSSDNGGTWTQITTAPVNVPTNWSDIDVSSNAQTQMAINGNDVYVSTDSGANWTIKSTMDFYAGGGNPIACSMSGDGQFQSVVKDGGRISVSNDTGNTWTSIINSQNWRDVSVSTETGQYQTAVGDATAIYISNDYGVTWNPVNIIKEWRSVSVSGNGQIQYAVSNNGYIYKSSDFGQTWNRITQEQKNWSCISVSEDSLRVSSAALSDNIYTLIDGLNVNIQSSVGIGTSLFTGDLCVYNSEPSILISGSSDTDLVSLYLGTPENGETIGAMKTAIIAEGIGNFSQSKLHFCLNASSDDFTNATISDSRLTITPSGNVGIGTASPTSNLHVIGNAVITGALNAGTITTTGLGSFGSLSVGTQPVTDSTVTGLNSVITGGTIFTRKNNLSNHVQLIGYDIFFQDTGLINPGDVLFTIQSGFRPSSIVVSHFIVYEDVTDPIDSTHIASCKVSIESNGTVRYLGSRDLFILYDTEDLSYPGGNVLFGNINTGYYL